MPISYLRSSGGYYYKKNSNGEKIRISKEKYLKNKKSGKKTSGKKGSPKRRSGSRVGYSKKKCRSHLSDKIGYNMKEFEDGKWKNRKQALAISYSQVNTDYPYCKRYFPKPN
jgi:hypothetical protein